MFSFLIFFSVQALIVSTQSSQNVTVLKQFCSTRPDGLYCFTQTEKVECPSLKTFTCPHEGNEMCQERGILRETGFRGGIARCVPKLNESKVEEFCAPKPPGLYCWGNANTFELNIKVHCPSGLVYKCSPTFAPDNICLQQYERYAICTGTGTDLSNGTTCSPVFRFVTVTKTVTEPISVADCSSTAVLTSASVGLHDVDGSKVQYLTAVPHHLPVPTNE